MVPNSDNNEEGLCLVPIRHWTHPFFKPIPLLIEVSFKTIAGNFIRNRIDKYT